MTASQRTILDTLKKNTNPTTGTGIQSYSLANRVGQPEPSMRRNIQSLRKLGYDIRASYYGYILHNQGTTLTANTTTTGTGTTGTRF